MVQGLAEELSRVQLALAYLPVYMIFHDHDLTDNWNLWRGWKGAVYNNPFSWRIISNALIGYWLFQAWGNARSDSIAAFTTRRIAVSPPQARISVGPRSVENNSRLALLILNGIDMATSRALVVDTAEQLGTSIRGINGACLPWLPGYRVKVLDGNCIEATHH